jgi:hypothetical protein
MDSRAGLETCSGEVLGLTSLLYDYLETSNYKELRGSASMGYETAHQYSNQL